MSLNIAGLMALSSVIQVSTNTNSLMKCNDLRFKKIHGRKWLEKRTRKNMVYTKIKPYVIVTAK